MYFTLGLWAILSEVLGLEFGFYHLTAACHDRSREYNALFWPDWHLHSFAPTPSPDTPTHTNACS